MKAIPVIFGIVLFLIVAALGRQAWLAKQEQPLSTRRMASNHAWSAEEVKELYDDMTKAQWEYRVAWESQITGATGHGSWFADYAMIERTVEKGNYMDKGDIHYWVERQKKPNGLIKAIIYLTTPIR